MGFTEVADAYAAHRAKHRPDEETSARAELAAFLDVGDAAEEPVISTDVRVVLVSADFGREITTTVLWLNGFDGMDIRCFRLIPYAIDDKVLLDIQQVLPLPEAADYQVRLRRKDVARERARSLGGTSPLPHRHRRRSAGTSEQAQRCQDHGRAAGAPWCPPVRDAQAPARPVGNNRTKTGAKQPGRSGRAQLVATLAAGGPG